MISNEKMYSNVLRREAEYFEKKKRQKKIIVCTTASLSGLCAAAAVGIGIWTNVQIHNPSGGSPTIENVAVTDTGSNRDNNHNSETEITAVTETVTNISEEYVSGKKENGDSKTSEESGYIVTASDTGVPAVTEVPVSQDKTSDTGVPAVTEVPSSQDKPSVSSVSVKKEETPAVSDNRPAETEPEKPHTAGPVTDIEEESNMTKARRSIAMFSAMAMAMSSGNIVSHAYSIQYDTGKGTDTALYIDENLDLLDFDADGKTDIYDVYALSVFLNERESLPEGYAERIEKYGDVNGDGKTDRADLEGFEGYHTSNHFYEDWRIVSPDDYLSDLLDYFPYGSDDIKINFSSELLSFDETGYNGDTIGYSEPRYRKLCNKIDSGELSADINLDGNTDLKDAYDLYIYFTEYLEWIGKSKFNKAAYPDWQDIVLSDEDKTRIENAGNAFREIISVSGEKEFGDYQYQLLYMLYDFGIAVRYYMEHCDISAEDLQLKTYEDIYNFEYSDEFLKRYFTKEENFLCEISDIMKSQKIIPDQTAEEGDFTFSISGDHAELFSYNGNDETVVIPSEVNGLPVTSVFRYSCNNLNMKKLVIPDTVTEIQDGAFWKCTELTEIKFSDNLVTVGENAFSGCTKIVSLELPESLKEIKAHAFSGLEKIKTLVIPEGTEKIGYWAFHSCPELRNVTIPDSVKSIGIYAFDSFDTTSDDNSTEFSGDIAISGHSGSAAEKYASDNKITFIDVDKSPEKSSDTAVSKPKPEKSVKGDVDGSGTVDLTDLTQLSLCIIGDIGLSDEQTEAADVDGDGEVRLTDAAKMRQYLSKIIESL